jgi:hypothetical protein
MKYTVKEIGVGKFMLIAETGEPVLATMNNRDLAQRMATKLTAESVTQGINATRGGTEDEQRARSRHRYQTTAHCS